MSKIPPRIVRPVKKRPDTKKTETSNEQSNADDKFLIDVDGETERKSFSFLLVVPLLLLVSSMALLFYMNQSGRSLASILPGKSSKATEQITKQEPIVIADKPVAEPSEPEPAATEESFSTIGNIQSGTHVAEIPAHPAEIKQPKPVKFNKDIEISENPGKIISSRTGKYFIIVGSFSEKSNALKLNKKIIRNGGIPVIIGPNGANQFYKVAVAGFTDVNTAIAKLDTYKPSFGSGVWIMSY
jgi:hypothetical protein